MAENDDETIAKLKEAQRERWATFYDYESVTATAAPKLVRFAGIERGKRVLDVGCGTGVVALTAARTAGAGVTGIDLTPELLERAKENARVAGVQAEWHHGDVEALPFADATFDVVVSQFGHMFAPRPELAVREMLRVLAPGGTIAFSTWPPDLYTGKLFTMMASFAPPPPAGVESPVAWGVPDVIRGRLGVRVRDLAFDIGTMRFPAVSPKHFCAFMEQRGPYTKLLTSLDDARASEMRRALEALVTAYWDDNTLRQDFLMTRATKA